MQYPLLSRLAGLAWLKSVSGFSARYVGSVRELTTALDPEDILPAMQCTSSVGHEARTISGVKNSDSTGVIKQATLLKVVL